MRMKGGTRGDDSRTERVFILYGKEQDRNKKPLKNGGGIFDEEEPGHCSEEFLESQSAVDESIRRIIQKKTVLSPEMTRTKEEAFALIRKQAMQKRRDIKRRRLFRIGVAVASFAVFLVVCVVNPSLAGSIPLVGHVFERMGRALRFSGDFTDYVAVLSQNEDSSDAEQMDLQNLSDYPWQEVSVYGDYMMRLSEVYCNKSALYISLIIESENIFPDTKQDQFGNMLLDLMGDEVEFSYVTADEPLSTHRIYHLEGEMADDHTYAGVLRIDLMDTGTKNSLQENGTGGIDEKKTETDLSGIPDEFTVDFHFTSIIGYRRENQIPEIPEDLEAQYCEKMQWNGLSTDPDAYLTFSPEQKEIADQLMQEKLRQYYIRYPEALKHPNEYMNWWEEGDWGFHIQVTVNHQNERTYLVDNTDLAGLETLSFIRTPFEIACIEENKILSGGYFPVILDEKGELLRYSGGSKAWPLNGKSPEYLDLFICDYARYMDELKGYYYSPDYEEKKKTMTFRELLMQEALYYCRIVM